MASFSWQLVRHCSGANVGKQGLVAGEVAAAAAQLPGATRS